MYRIAVCFLCLTTHVEIETLFIRYRNNFFLCVLPKRTNWRWEKESGQKIKKIKIKAKKLNCLFGGERERERENYLWIEREINKSEIQCPCLIVSEWVSECRLLQIIDSIISAPFIQFLVHTCVRAIVCLCLWRHSLGGKRRDLRYIFELTSGVESEKNWIGKRKSKLNSGRRQKKRIQIVFVCSETWKCHLRIGNRLNN